MNTNKPEGDEFEPVGDVQFIRIELDNLSGEELKNLMEGGHLPEEYINERNLRVLLRYEYECMRNSEYYDVSVIIYCTDLIIRNYTNDERMDWWAGAFENISRTVRTLDGSMKRAQLEFFVGQLAIRYPDRAKDRQFVQAHIDKFTQYFGMGNYQLPTETAEPEKSEEKAEVSGYQAQPITKEHRARVLSSVSKRVIIASVVFLVFLSGFSITAINTNLFGAPGAFTRGLWQTLMGVSRVEQGDVLRAGAVARRYSTVEEFEQSTGIRILVPTWLPSGLEITYIHYLHEEGRVDVLYPDNVIWFNIELNVSMPDICGAVIREHNNVVFCVVKDANIILWEYDDNFYQLGFEFDIYEYIEPIIIGIK